MKILAFTGSNSSTSRNRRLLEYCLRSFADEDLQYIDLRDYPLPLYCYDLEVAGQWPENLFTLKEMFQSSDAFIIASPEHNGQMPVFLKNTLDWLSRMYKPIFGAKPVFLLSTSTGSNGGKSNLQILKRLMPLWGAKIETSFSLPFFDDHFDSETGHIIHPEYQEELNEAIMVFKGQLERIELPDPHQKNHLQ